MRSTLLSLSLFAVLALACFGQTFGEITGVVTDSSGAVVAGATVSVTNPETSVTRTAMTNSAGNYTFPSLLPGIYSVKAEQQGFQAEVRTAVELQVQQVARIDFQLKVGSMAETIEVAGGAPLLNTENATVGTVIENKVTRGAAVNPGDVLYTVGMLNDVWITASIYEDDLARVHEGRYLDTIAALVGM